MDLRRSRTDLALAAVGLLVAVWAVAGAGPSWRWRVALLVVAVGPLLGVSRRWPIPAVAVSLAALVLADGAGDETESAFLLAVVVSCFVAGRFAPLIQLPWVGAGVLLLVSGTLWDAGAASFADAVFPVVLTAGPCLLGLSVQLAVRREREVRDGARLMEEMHAEELRRAGVEERLRIARDLHDIVAHDISAVSLQAQVARREAEAGRAVPAASLARIEETAQQAMTDARRLLGLLQEYDDRGPAPIPGVEDVPGLVGQARSMGQDVDLAHTGEPRSVAPALSQAIYRMVQESLTNARRHGAPGTTTVRLAWQRTGLHLRVTNPATTTGTPPAGHGIAGISERAAMFGGTATTGGADGEWTVDVRLPLPDGAAHGTAQEPAP